MNPYLKKNKNLGKWTSLLITVLAYLLAYFIAVFTFRQFIEFGDIYGILIADIAATFVIFFIGLIFSNASLYDPYWSIVPLGIVIYWWSISDYETSIDKILLMIVVIFWSVRLTLNWIRGWPGFVHEDWRYEMLRKQNGKWYQLVNISGIHLLPTVLVFLACVPAYFVLSKTTQYHSITLWIAFVLGIAATLIELISDEQMKNWIGNGRPGGIMKTGLWRYSRHPNYFGEVLFWFSLWVFALAISVEYLWTIVGVIAMLVLFLFASIPMMDKRSLDRRPGFKEHMDKTSGFLLLPPKSS